jgi:DUF4097 and DUF4098 domain-containing protein YvlB
MTKTMVKAAALLLAVAPAALAQERVDLKKNADPKGRVRIDNTSGSTRVIGWDRPEVTVTGTLGHGAEAVRFTGGAGRTDIEVETRGNPHGAKADLEIHVPSGSNVEVQSFSAEITVTGVTGAVRAESMNGAISVTGSDEVEAQTVSAGVTVSGGSRVRAESVNGPVTVKGAKGSVEASTVNGPLEVSGTTFESVRLEAVSGDVTFDGALASGADLSIETVSGSVTVRVPGGQGADVDVSTFSGDIQNGLSPDHAAKTSRWTSQQELQFKAGGGGAKVAIQTMSGNVEILKK